MAAPQEAVAFIGTCPLKEYDGKNGKLNCSNYRPRRHGV